MNPSDNRDPLVRGLLGPDGPELSCEECFDQLDRDVGPGLAGANAGAEVPGRRAHLEGCPACHDDHQSLRDLVASGDV